MSATPNLPQTPIRREPRQRRESLVTRMDTPPQVARRTLRPMEDPPPDPVKQD